MKAFELGLAMAAFLTCVFAGSSLAAWLTIVRHKPLLAVMIMIVGMSIMGVIEIGLLSEWTFSAN